jgi:N,N'-diacetyllegionaminate synthase
MIVVAEIGLNHDGRWDRAYEMVRQAALAGATIAKFQFGWRHQPGEMNHVTPELAARLKEWCDYFGIEFMASIIAEDSLALAREVGPRRFKIASRTVIDNPKLVERVLAEGKETFVSLGWWLKEGRTGWPFGPPNDQLRYIFCQSSYPTYPSQLGALPAQFSSEGFYGFSDHTHGIEACLLSIARGAQFVEKHFTLDKTIVAVHNDHVLSCDPGELRALSEHGSAIARLVRALSGGTSAAPPPVLPKA